METANNEESRESEGFNWLVASILDHPSIYMGGPSRQSKQKAERIRSALIKEGWGLIPPPPKA